MTPWASVAMLEKLALLKKWHLVMRPPLAMIAAVAMADPLQDGHAKANTAAPGKPVGKSQWSR